MVASHKSTLSRIKYAVWSTFEKAFYLCVIWLYTVCIIVLPFWCNKNVHRRGAYLSYFLNDLLPPALEHRATLHVLLAAIRRKSLATLDGQRLAAIGQRSNCRLNELMADIK